MAHQVNAAVERVQATSFETNVDCAAAEPERGELSTSDDAVLAGGKLGKLAFEGRRRDANTTIAPAVTASVEFGTYVGVKSTGPASCPSRVALLTPNAGKASRCCSASSDHHL